MSFRRSSGAVAARGSGSSVRIRQAIESLESRRLLTAVAWDGGGDGVNWSDGNNWSNNAVPTSADDVTIDVATNPTIILRGGRTVRSLVNAETLRILGDSTAGSASLTINVSADNTGTMVLDSADSTWASDLRVADGGAFTNNASLQAVVGSGGVKTITLGAGGAGVTSFVNNGTLSAAAGLSLEINGTGGSLDTFTQNGTVNIGSGGAVTLGTLRLNYIGGSNQAGFSVRNAQIDLDAASSASTVIAGATNTFLGHDAANITLRVEGNNQFGSATLNISSNASSSGVIELDSINSSWTSTINVADGVTFTNSGTIRANSGTGGQRVIHLGAGGAPANLFINNGTIASNGIDLPIEGTGGSVDEFRQNGTLTCGGGGTITANNVLLHYIGGSNNDGFIVRGNSQIDLAAAASPSTVVALGTNRFVGHDATNLSLVIQGGNAGGSAQLNVTANAVNSGLIVLETITSSWTCTISVSDGVLLTNNGTIRAAVGSGGQRIVQLGSGGANSNTFINNGTIDVVGGVDLTIDGTNGSVDTFTQNGSITLASGGTLSAGNLLLNYTGGSNSDGFSVRGNCQIDLDAASSASTVTALGTNRLIGHDAANITLLVMGNNAGGNATLNVPANAVSSGLIVLDSANSSWTAQIAIADGASLTNAGTIRVKPGSGGQKLINLGSGGPTAGPFTNNGLIDVLAGVDLQIGGTTGSDDTFTQNGTLNIASGSKLFASNVSLHYIGGSNQPRFFATGGTRIDLDAAAAPSTVIAGGNVSLVGHDAANITLLVQGNSASGIATLNVPANAQNSSLIVLDVIDSSWSARINVPNGVTFANTPGGTIQIKQNTFGGTRAIDVGTTVGNPGVMNNAGVILLSDDVDLAGSGKITNSGTIRKPAAGESTFDAQLVNTPTGLVDVQAGTLRFNGATNIGDAAGAFLSGGFYRVANAATLAFGFSPAQNPTINTADVEVTGTGVVEFGRLQFNRGRIALLDGADLAITPDVPNAFTNEGIVDLSSTSVLTVNGGMKLGGASQPIIRTEIASLTDFGRINVTGTLNLDSPLSTSRFDPDLISGYDPALNTQFNTITAGSIQNAFDSLQGGLTPGGNVLSVVRPSASILAVKIIPGPLPPPPQVLSQTFEYESRVAVTFTFDQDVSAFLSRKDYQLQNLTTATTLPNSVGLLSYNQASNEATLTLTNQISDGNYLLSINASDIANSAGVPSSGSPITLNFFYLAGDATRDRAVNLDDFTALAANFGVANRVFSDGDFNYDTTVNLDDFTILASQFGKNLPAPGDLPRQPGNSIANAKLAASASWFSETRVGDEILTADL